MSGISRREVLNLAAVSGAVAAAASLAGCSGVAGGGASSTEGAVRYAWWGNSVRQQNFLAAFEKFQADHPGVTISPEFADYTPYQERMTTQIAARNVADVFWVPSPQVMTYYANDMYREIDDVETLSLADYSEDDLESFRLDGKLNTMPFGTFVPVLRFNQTFADEDGVELPAEDQPMTWDELFEFAVDYARDNPNQRKAMPYHPDHDVTFESWVRQHGEQLWTADGQLGCSVDTAAGYLDWWDRLRRAGATTSLSEQDGIAPEWSVVGERTLVHPGSSNHIVDDAKQFPDYEFVLRHAAELPDAAADYHFLYYPRIAIYSGVDDSLVEAAGTIIDYQTNTTEVLRLVGMTLGAPPNPRVAQEAESFATEDEKKMLRIVAAERAAERGPRFDSPPGTNTWRTNMARAGEELALGSITVQRAAERLVEDINAGIDRAA